MSDAPSPAKSARPRPIFLALLGAVLAVLLLYVVWPAASPGSGPSNPPRQAQTGAAPAGPTAKKGAAEFDVRLGELQQPPPEPDQSDRNPFRFKPKPPPPPPPAPVIPKPGDANYVPPPPPPRIPKPGDPDYVPPPPPPIPLKFIGTMEQGRTRVAIFSDGKGMPLYGAEGKTILGQYRVVKIGVESVVMEYLDGRGRQTIPMKGGQ